MTIGLRGVRQIPVAVQQPPWEDSKLVEKVRGELAALPPLVEPESLGGLRDRLAEAAVGEALVLQAGDCAENPAECAADDVNRKVALLEVLAGVLTAISGRPVGPAAR